MPTRNVVLTDHQEEFIGECVESGRYKNASEVMREGLRLVQERSEERALRLEALQKALEEADASVAKGEVYDYTPNLLNEIDAEAGSV